MPTILQLTDLHLLADPAGTLKGKRVRETTERLMQDVRTQIGSGSLQVDRIVLSGDLAHDELCETYLLLRDLLGELLPHCLLLPGNHDSRPFMREVFPELFEPEDAFLCFSVSAGAWRLIGLDSHIPGEVCGEISRPQLDWLMDELRAHAQQPTVLFLHHPPFEVGSAWVDSIGLVNSHELMQSVSDATQLKAICAGHVHHEFAAQSNGMTLLTSPSASLQFVPACDDLALDTRPPGYRLLHLDKQFDSEVVRLEV